MNGGHVERKTPRGGRRALAVVVLLGTAVVIAVAVLLFRGTERSSAAVDVVKEATARVLAHHKTRVQRADGEMSVTWSTTPMQGGQMVEAVVQSTVPGYSGRAVFMVTSSPKTILADNDFAASLLGEPNESAVGHP